MFTGHIGIGKADIDRLPSNGCHNKVKWILSTCAWDCNKVQEFTFVLLQYLNDLFWSDNIPCPRKKSFKWICSWTDACDMANWYVGNNCENLYYLIVKYPWFNRDYNNSRK